MLFSGKDMNQIILNNSGIKTVSYDYPTNLEGYHYRIFNWYFNGNGSLNLFYDDTISHETAKEIFSNAIKTDYLDVIKEIKKRKQ